MEELVALGTGEAARRAGLLAEARAAFLASADAAARSGDDPALVQAALGVGGLWVHEQRDVVGRAQVWALWDKAAAVVLPGSLDQARLAARLAAEAVYEGEPAEALGAAVEAVRGFGQDYATAEALSMLHHVRLGPRSAESRLGIADEMIQLAARARDPVLVLMGLCWRTVDLFLAGSPRAPQSLNELRQRSEAEGCEAIAFIAQMLGAMTISRSGRLAAAEAAASAAAEQGERVGDPDGAAYYAAIIAAQRWWQGRAGEILTFVRELSASPKLGYNDHVYVAADAALSASAGDIDSAEEALARLDSIGLDRLPESSTWLTTQALVSEAAFVLGDPDLARQASRLIGPFAHLPVMPSLASVCLGSAERALGLTAATTGHLDAAVHHLDAAVVADRRLGNRPMTALTTHTLAGVLTARDAPGDAARAEHLARRASEQAAKMAMCLPMHPDWLTGGRGSIGSAPTVRSVRLDHVPGGWRLTFEHRVSLLPDRVGFAYLAQLLDNPGRDLDATGLVTRGSPSTVLGVDTVLDAAAIRDYRRRRHELRALVSSPNIVEPAASRHREELAAIDTFLRTATGLGGRLRAFPDSRERARTAVRKALMRAVDAITAVEPEVGHHLTASLVTGATCRYSPTVGWSYSVRVLVHHP